MGCPCMAKDKWQGPRRGEYCAWPSRQARLHTGNNRIKPSAAGPCGSMLRRPPAVLPPPPFPFARKEHPQRVPPTGRHPPLGGGRTLALAPFSEYRSAIARLLSPSSKFPEEPNRFFGDYSGTTSGIPRMQGTKRATGHPPLREGGGAAINGRRMHGKNKRQGPRRGEYCGRPSRQARLHTAPKESSPPQMDHAKACIHGHPQYSPHRPFLPLRTCIHEPSSFGRHPPLGGGRMRAHAPFSKYLSTISRPSSPSTIIPEEPKCPPARRFPSKPSAPPRLRVSSFLPRPSRKPCGLCAFCGLCGFPKVFSNRWKTAERFFQSLEKSDQFFQPLENFFPIIGKLGDGRGASGLCRGR